MFLFPPNATAQLTDVGLLQQQQLGDAIRTFYVDTQGFLPESYNAGNTTKFHFLIYAGDVFVRYDTDSRTKQSALVVAKIYLANIRRVSSMAYIPKETMGRKSQKYLMFLQWIENMTICEQGLFSFA